MAVHSKQVLLKICTRIHTHASNFHISIFATCHREPITSFPPKKWLVLACKLCLSFNLKNKQLNQSSSSSSISETVQISSLCGALPILWGYRHSQTAGLAGVMSGGLVVVGARTETISGWSATGISGTVPTILGGALYWVATGGRLTTSASPTATVSGATPHTSVGSTAVSLSWSICRHHIIPDATWTLYISGPVFLMPLQIPSIISWHYCVTNL